jgi:hypothetical protein
MVGTERIMVNSAGDWGKSDPLAVPEFIQEMKRRGHTDAVIRKIVYENPLAFFRQANNWREDHLGVRGPTASTVAEKATPRIVTTFSS